MTTCRSEAAVLVLRMLTKRCFKCGETKMRGEFYAHRQMSDGLLGKCKDCTKADAKARRLVVLSTPEGLAKERERCRRKAHRQAHRSRSREVIQRARIKAVLAGKEKARSVLRRAVDSGRLVRLPCVVCGNPRSHGHHEDYSKPLEVVWLCAKHHGELHRKC